MNMVLLASMFICFAAGVLLPRFLFNEKAGFKKRDRIIVNFGFFLSLELIGISTMNEFMIFVGLAFLFAMFFEGGIFDYILKKIRGLIHA